MRIPMMVCALALLLTSGAWADPFLIVPGQSIGRTHLGRNGDFYLKHLPPPTSEDSSLGGNLYQIWRARDSRDTLYLHTYRNDNMSPPRPGVTICEIRVTSPHFHTKSGVSPGATLAQIKRCFTQGHLKPVSNKSCFFYTVGRQGIAFEFARPPRTATHCIAVTVYPPGPSNIFATAEQVQDILNAGRNEGTPRQ